MLNLVVFVHYVSCSFNVLFQKERERTKTKTRPPRQRGANVKAFTTAWPRQTTDFFYISQSYWLTLDFSLQIFNSLLLSGMLGWKEFLQQSLSFWTSIVNVSLS